jgi:hypothetical protein
LIDDIKSCTVHDYSLIRGGEKMTNYSLEWIVNQILYWLDPYWNFSTNEEKITELLFFCGVRLLRHRGLRSPDRPVFQTVPNA